MKITVVGAGYVGLVTGACLSELGHSVICVDSNSERVIPINEGVTPFYEPGLAELVSRNTRIGQLRAEVRLEDAMPGSELTFIAVGTPSVGGAIDLSQVLSVAKRLGNILGEEITKHTVVVKSSVIPGTTDGPVRDTIAAAAGVDRTQVPIAMNPEFLRQGAAVEDFMRPDRIVVGAAAPEIAARVMSLYDKLDTAARIATTTANAELIKYTTNTFLATAISFSNEIANICERTPGADVAVVMQGLHLDRRLTLLEGGNRVFAGIVSYLSAGCGFGGSCLPKDVRAFVRYAEDNQATNGLLRAVIDINDSRSRWLVERLRLRIGDLSGRTVLLIGIAFKPGTDDLRDSPALGVLDALVFENARVLVWDPYVAEKQLVAAGNIVKIDDIAAGVSECDAVVITANFTELISLDWREMLARSRCIAIIDGRGVLAGIELPPTVSYDVVGRQPYNAPMRIETC